MVTSLKIFALLTALLDKIVLKINVSVHSNTLAITSIRWAISDLIL